MSVIVFHAGIVAADTRAGFGNGWISPERAQKIWTTPHGVAGIVGDWAPVDVIREWTFTNLKKPPPKVGEKTTIIEFHRGAGLDPVLVAVEMADGVHHEGQL